jgi:magnesium transporter
MSNTTQRSKIEEYDDYIFMVLKVVHFSEEDNNFSVEQISLVV